LNGYEQLRRDIGDARPSKMSDKSAVEIHRILTFSEAEFLAQLPNFFRTSPNSGLQQRPGIELMWQLPNDRMPKGLGLALDDLSRLVDASKSGGTGER